MNPADVERFLTQAVADRKLSGGERQALAGWLAQHVKTDQHRGVVRHTAFAVARRAVADPAAAEVIGWLEDVLKVVAPVQAPAAGPAPAGSLPESVCFSPGEGCLRAIVARFNGCRRTADVCVFTITDDRISRAILDAHGRGVRVRVITDNEKAHDLGSDVHSLQLAGIPVKFDAARPTARGPGPVDGHMHHKFAVFDGARLLNGSYNWTRGAADANYENLVETDDPALVAAFAAEFDRLWAAF